VRPLVLILLFAGAASASTDAAPVICLDDRVGMDARAMAAFDRELDALAGHRTSCAEGSGIRISIRTHAPGRYPAALGLAWTAGDRVLPLIELYSVNIVKTLGGQVSSERFGRALARVAFHELRHYTRQERDHDTHGLFSRSMHAPALLTSAEQ
jgi:hypothetical protein